MKSAIRFFAVIYGLLFAASWFLEADYTVMIWPVAALYVPMYLLKRGKRDVLDQTLFHWSDKTPFTVRDLLLSVAIFGQTGSGKSSGSGLLLARAVLRLKRSGGLILVSKPEDRQFWLTRFKEAGRLKDLTIFGEHEKARFNFVDFEMKSGGDARSLTEFLLITSEGLDKGGRGDNGKFWELSKKRMLYCAIEPCRVAWGQMDIPIIQQFITTAIYDSAQLSEVKPEGGGDSPKEKFMKGMHYQTMSRAATKLKTNVERNDWMLYDEYWKNEFVTMDGKVRSSVLADTLNILHTLNAGIVQEMVSTTTNFTPAAMAKGKWVLVDFPIDVYGDSGRIIMHGMKMLTQKFILRRHTKPGDSVIVVHADEAQDVVNSFDSAFLAKCRSHLGCMIFLTQSLHSYFGKDK